MASYIQQGDTINFTNNTSKDIFYGDVIKIGSRVGIAATNIPIGAIGTLSIVGVYEILAVKTEEFKVGDKLYLNEEGLITKTVGDIYVGFAVEDKAQSSSLSIVKID